MKGIGFTMLWSVTAATASGCLNSPPGIPVQQPKPVPAIYDWTVQTTSSLIDLNDVFFIDPYNGWAVGNDQAVFSTVNGGQDWPLAPISALVSNLRSVYLLDSQRGWMAGGIDDNPDGYLFMSSNGGAYPEPKETVNGPLNTVFFLDDVRGWAAGKNGLILSTSDGVTWETGSIGDPETINDIQFLSASMGWAAAMNGGIYHTDDGVMWTREALPVSSDVNAIFFSDEGHGWGCGAGNLILIGHVDGGDLIEWTISSVPGEPANISWSDIFFVDLLHGWVTGEAGNVYKTIDGGQTWTPETTGLTLDLNAIHMVDASTGWIVGDEGTILRYTPK